MSDGENQFTRGVTREGNRKAQAIVAEVFELRPGVCMQPNAI